MERKEFPEGSLIIDAPAKVVRQLALETLEGLRRSASYMFFVVFFNTFEGTRVVDRDQIAASRLLGANSWTVTRTVVIPSTLAWVFASLTPAVSFALIG
ncbi:ABC transporter permease subunit [Microvirga sp. 2TAF3]|uniref:ABC transporter permease subunit n=1 Tax=Microvirga sp. 2TAF3 TaxID=3233014 RepID=UPI003F9B9327